MDTESTEGHREHRDEGRARINRLNQQVIGLAIEVHRELGPGMLEQAYETCLCLELTAHNIPFARQVTVPVTYKSTVIERAFRVDILVADTLVLEIKAIETLLPVHISQVLTSLRFGRYPVGLLFNFNALRLLDGLKRVSL